MTDTKPDNTSDSGSATRHDKPNQKKVAPATGARVAKSSRRSSIVVAILILLLIVAALAAAVWYQHRVMHERVDALLGQAQQSSRESQAASGQAMQAFGLARQHQQKIEQMAGELETAQQHLQSLEQALQMMTDSGTDIALINDMDHLVSIAHQQLLLGGNVSNAIIALETAQAQLARANRPNLASLQQAINGDVERLRAVSTIDINRLSSRIDELGRLIESAPLLIPDDAAPALAPNSAATKRHPAPVSEAKAHDPSAPWWKQGLSSAAEWSRHTWFNVKQDLAGFISVRRVDDAAALLMSPEQAGSLRDKLRLRLMTAQLALLMKQPDVWATETRAVVQLLQARYDINSVEGHRALRLALQLADTSIKLDLPTVANSQSAIQTLREETAKSAQNGLNGTETAEQAPNQSTGQGAASDGDTNGAAETPADEAVPESTEGTPGSTAPAEGSTGTDAQGSGELVEGADSGEPETANPSSDPTPAATSASAGVRIAMTGV